MNIGSHGPGIAGAAMALHLAAVRPPLDVDTVGPLPRAIADSSAVPCASAAEVARRADVVLTIVPDTPDVEALPFGADGVTRMPGNGGPRQRVVDTGSIAPMATKRFARPVDALGAVPVDAPVSGGEVGAEAESPTIMRGGDPAVFDPVRERTGRNISQVGRNGDGRATLPASPIIVALDITVVGEALRFARRAGADPARVRQAPMGGFASSRILEAHGERVTRRRFDPGVRTRLHPKDPGRALQGARGRGASLPQTVDAAPPTPACASAGLADLNPSARVKAAQPMRNHAVAEGR